VINNMVECFAIHESEIQEVCEFEMPEGAEILACKKVDAHIVLYVMLDYTKPSVKRSFMVTTTGMKFDPDKLTHVGTVKDPVNYSFSAYHIFEVK